tara:strand:- start:3594 stop:3797 length:204 start_codon:yes stop_codon:yes gene_type:complete
MPRKKTLSKKKVIPKELQQSVVAQEITSDFVLEIYEKAKRARTKEKKESLIKVAELLSKNIGSFLVE